jgi:hypothetical protein
MGRAMAQIDIETIDQLPLPSNNIQKGSGTADLPKSLAVQYEQYIKDPSNENMKDICAKIMEMNPHNSLVFLVKEIIELYKTEECSQPSGLIQILAIDNLINCIVYHLYDLNEEEILFVEEQSNL